jgi:hypothetical protein
MRRSQEGRWENKIEKRKKASQEAVPEEGPPAAWS